MQEVDDVSFGPRVIGSLRPVLVLFTAPRCLPCEVLARGLPELAAELGAGIEIVLCPVDDAPATAAAYRIAGTPTLILFQSGELLASYSGVWPIPAIRAWLLNLLPPAQHSRSSSTAPGWAESTRAFLRAFFRAGTAIRGCKMAAVVAPILLFVNHSELLLRAPLSSAVLRHLALNFLVPFLVSSYSTARAVSSRGGRVRGTSEHREVG